MVAGPWRSTPGGVERCEVQGSQVDCSESERCRVPDDGRACGLRSRRGRLPFTEMGTAKGEAGSGGYEEFASGFVEFEMPLRHRMEVLRGQLGSCRRTDGG